MSLLNEGPADYRIVELGPYTSKAGNASIKAVLEATQRGNSVKIFEYLTGKRSRTIHEMFVSLGRAPDPDFLSRKTFDDYIGATGRAIVNVELGTEIPDKPGENYPDKNRIKKFLAQEPGYKDKAPEPIETKYPPVDFKDTYYQSERYRFPHGTPTERFDAKDDIDLPF
jgi:hypothetical protein